MLGRRGTAATSRHSPVRADPLSDVLRVVRLDGAFFYAVEASAPWSVEAVAAKEILPRILPGAEHLISYHILTAGRCWGGLIGTARGTRTGRRARVSARRPTPDVECPGTADGKYGGRGDAGSVSRNGDARRRGAGHGHVRLWLPRLRSTPVQSPPVHAAASASPAGLSNGWLQSFAHQVVEESRARRAGADSVLTRLAELMFVEVLRRYIETLPPGRQGWLAGLRDNVVGRGLGLLHGAPAHAWTIDELAGDVAMSRSAFADRFTAIVGQPPMQYLAQWRMQLAAGRLATGNAKVAAIAEEVGYDSEAAFSRAFKRLMGVSPATWRRAREKAGGTV